MPAPTNLDLLRTALGCEHLPADWYDFYGVRKARNDALTTPTGRPSGFTSDSFDNPSSETALTLFMLTNTDGWKQLDAFAERPRIAGDRWNPNFFDGLATAPPDPFARPSLWSRHTGEGKLFSNDDVDCRAESGCGDGLASARSLARWCCDGRVPKLHCSPTALGFFISSHASRGRYPFRSVLVSRITNRPLGNFLRKLSVRLPAVRSLTMSAVC